ncbi:MAG: hypothetical protein WC517_00845 [Patescibacteria group bacterium]
MPKQALASIKPTLARGEIFTVPVSPMTIEQLAAGLIKLGAIAEVDARINSKSFPRSPLRAGQISIQVVSFSWNSINEKGFTASTPMAPSARTLLLSAGETVKRLTAEMPGARAIRLLEFLQAMLAQPEALNAKRSFAVLGDEWIGECQLVDEQQRLIKKRMPHVVGTFNGNLAPMPLGEHYEIKFGLGWNFPVILPNPAK